MDLEKEVRLIKARNARVEADKAWETTWTRTVTIAMITYISVLTIFLVIRVQKPFLTALVTMLGFILSIQSIPIVKEWWLKKNQR